MNDTTGPIRVEATLVQLTFARELIRTHEAQGDCKLHGFTLEFPDYEGAAAFLHAVYALPAPTTRAYVTSEVLARKINAAILAAVKEGKK